MVGMGTDFDANAGIGIGISDGVVAGVAIGAENPGTGAAAVPVSGEPGASTF